MEKTIEKIAGSQYKISFKLSQEEQIKYENKAITALGKTKEFKGFRPGSAPAELIKKEFGEEAVKYETMWEALKDLYPKAVNTNNLDVVGEPKSDLISYNPLAFFVTVAYLPEVDITGWDKVSVTKKEVKVDESEVDKFLDDVRQSRASEAAVDRAADKGDKVLVDFEIIMDKVAIEGGTQKNYPVIVGRGQLLPTFEDNMVGMKNSEEKTFDFVFPDNYQPAFAGKKATAKLKLNQVFARTLPELNDEFAAKLGKFSSLDDLKKQLRENLELDQKAQAEQKLEREMLDTLVKAIKIPELPEILVVRETEAMIHELEHSVEHQGITWPDYLQHIKKDEASLKDEFKEAAKKRVAMALITRQLVKQFSLEVEQKVLDEELKNALAHHQHDADMVNYMQTENYKDYLRSNLTNQKVVEWLKERLVK